MKRLVLLLRNMFTKEWAWRLFLSLQTFALMALIYTDLSAGEKWSFLPDFLDYRGQPQFSWAIFEGYHWTRYRYNWVFVAALFGPFLVARATDWIMKTEFDDNEIKPVQNDFNFILNKDNQSIFPENSKEIVNVVNVKSEVNQIVGKRISGLVMKAATRQNYPPKNQIFLLFDDGTYYEFYTQDCEIRTTSGVVRGTLDDVLSYMDDTRIPIWVHSQE